jgi:hypothetical protein
MANYSTATTTKSPPSLIEALVKGGVGFAVVSLCVFATVAFAERWMYAHLGPAGAYLTWTALFILLGGAVLGSLVVGRWRLPGFYVLFGLGFLAYAGGWVVAYFTLHGRLGEWVGSVAGSILMALVFGSGFAVSRSIPKLAVILFAANSLGYFAGSVLFYSLGAPTGMLLWGVIYGFCLGAGIGAVLHLAQIPNRES